MRKNGDPGTVAGDEALLLLGHLGSQALLGRGLKDPVPVHVGGT